MTESTKQYKSWAASAAREKLQSSYYDPSANQLVLYFVPESKKFLFSSSTLPDSLTTSTLLSVSGP